MDGVSVGSVVFVRFPFSDLSGVKKRPALVLARLAKNDLILCQITSRSYADLDAVELRQESFCEGRLISLSFIRPGKIFTANLSIVESCVARIRQEVHQATVCKIETLLNSGY